MDSVSTSHQPRVGLSVRHAKPNNKLLKVILLCRLHILLCSFYKEKHQPFFNHDSMECYEMDSKVIQNIIHEILETGDYTLEGIAHHTRIPFDVIYDAACGVMAEFSITPWSRVVAIYLQVKPEIADQLMEWLLAGSDRSLPGLLSTITSN